MPDRSVGTSTVAYGIERMNREVSHWMRGLTENDNDRPIPFIATRGYDSVVWNRLYSRDVSDFVDYQNNQVIILIIFFFFNFYIFHFQKFGSLKLGWTEFWKIQNLFFGFTEFQFANLTSSLAGWIIDLKVRKPGFEKKRSVFSFWPVHWLLIYSVHFF